MKNSDNYNISGIQDSELSKLEKEKIWEEFLAKSPDQRLEFMEQLPEPLRNRIALDPRMWIKADWENAFKIILFEEKLIEESSDAMPFPFFEKILKQYLPFYKGMKNFNQSKDSEPDVIDSLLDKLPEQARSTIKNHLNKLINYTPKIGVMGKSGAGKSSLINAILGKPLCQTGGVGGCTREFQEEKLTIGKRSIIFMDLPGVAENQDRQKEYAKLYEEKLPELDLILWVIKADDRANIDDEKFYNFLTTRYKKEQILFVLSQADKSEPSDEWDHINEYKPSVAQQNTIDANRRRFSEDFNVSVKDVIAVACKYKDNNFKRYNFDQLVERMIEQLPSEAKSSFYSNTDKKNRTKKAEETAKNDFGDTVNDLIDDVIDILPITEPLKKVAKTAKNLVVKGLKKLWNYLFD